MLPAITGATNAQPQVEQLRNQAISVVTLSSASWLASASIVKESPSSTKLNDVIGRSSAFVYRVHVGTKQPQLLELTTSAVKLDCFTSTTVSIVQA